MLLLIKKKKKKVFYRNFEKHLCRGSFLGKIKIDSLIAIFQKIRLIFEKHPSTALSDFATS